MYKNIIFLIITLILFSGCLNKRGISGSYYNDCREYYDARGYYHKNCDENLVEFSDLKKDVSDAYDATTGFITFTQEVEEKEPEHKLVW